jgi:hypothetical protein
VRGIDMSDAERIIYSMNESIISLEDENAALKHENEQLTVIIKGILKATMGFTVPIKKDSE